jgi:hypothetical protein
MGYTNDYDRDRLERSSPRRVISWFIVVTIGFFFFAQLYATIIGPYAGFAYDRWDKISESESMITSDTCSNKTKIVEIGSYRSTCDLARKRVAQGIFMGAFNDLMKYWQMCDRGMCYIGPVNVTSVLFYVVLGAVVMMLVLWCVGIAQFSSAYHAYDVGRHQLPMKISGEYRPPQYVMIQEKEHIHTNPIITAYTESIAYPHVKHD